MRIAALARIVFATALIIQTAHAATPDGFAIYSKGDDYNRTLHLRRLTTSGVGAEQKICDKGPDGGDIEGQISFDGRFVAFARSLSGTSDSYGGNDYHGFDKWDVYLVRVDGSLPATPKRVAHGYWPSWGDDSYNATKTLYYSTHPEGAVRAVTVDANGNLSNDRLVHNVKNHWSSGFEGFVMAGPNGRFCAGRWSGAVHVAHWSGALSGQKHRLNGGCHPSVGADNNWVFHANHKKGRVDGTQTGDLSGAGDYHYGSSPDMQWFVSRTQGNYQVQNDGFNVHLFSMTTTQTSVSIHQEVLLTNDGSWCDVHAGEPPTRDVQIESFWADPASITTGSSTTLHWDVLSATSMTLNGETVTGNSTTVTPSTTTTYTLLAQGENGPVSDQVTVTVSAPVLTTITVTPQSQTVSLGEDVSFTATAKDQSGNPIAATIAWTSDGGTLAPSTGATTTFSSAAAGTFTITASSGSVSGTASATVLDPDAIHIKINCGSNDHDVAGWERDDGYVHDGGDWTNPNTVSVDGVADAAPAGVYRSVYHQSTHYYEIPVPDGDYLLRMHFADAYTDRSMTYTVEGVIVLENFDISSEAGGTNKALVKEFPVTVSDGNGMRIDCGGSGDVFECGLEVIGVGGDDDPGTIDIAAAHTGATYSIGEQVMVEWAASQVVTQVRLSVTVDEGEAWHDITTDNSVSRGDAEWGAYPWVIPESMDGTPMASSACLLRIIDYNNPLVASVSGLFSIEASAVGARSGTTGAHHMPVLRTGGANLQLVVPYAGWHEVDVLSLNGTVCSRFAGTGAQVYTLPAAPGVRLLRIRSAHGTQTLHAIVE